MDNSLLLDARPTVEACSEEEKELWLGSTCFGLTDCVGMSQASWGYAVFGLSLRVSGLAYRTRRSVGNNYIGHNYIGHNYTGHN